MENRRATNSEAYDVPDSTDWLDTPLAALMSVEQAFRCHVCKDFYVSPMLTSCSHTFCSICIRRCLGVDGKCPLCRANDQESKLRGNWALREAVDAFVGSRPSVLAHARSRREREAVAVSPKRKADEAGEEVEDDHVAGVRKRPRMSTRSSKARAAGPAAVEATAVEATAVMMGDEVEVPRSRDHTEHDPNDGLVACPICLARMKPLQVDRHLDTTCPGSPQPAPQPAASASRMPSSGIMGSFGPSRSARSSASAKSLERLPALNYSMLGDQALRKKMRELGISGSGSRQLLERRHKEWVTIWNANCDSARPKSRTELFHDLDVWERTQGGRAPAAFSSHAGAQIREKDFDGAAWAAKHDTSFRDLIADARRTRSQAAQRPKESSEPSPAPGGQGPGTAPTSATDGGQSVRGAEPGALIDLTGSPPQPRASPETHTGFPSEASEMQAASPHPGSSAGPGPLPPHGPPQSGPLPPPPSRPPANGTLPPFSDLQSIAPKWETPGQGI